MRETSALVGWGRSPLFAHYSNDAVGGGRTDNGTQTELLNEDEKEDTNSAERQLVENTGRL
jgi:hypothetical protein